MIILAICFAIIFYFQFKMLKASKSGVREKWISYTVTGVVFVYGVFCVFNPRWVSPNNPIRFVFEPVQRWLLQNPPPPDSSQ